MALIIQKWISKGKVVGADEKSSDAVVIAVVFLGMLLKARVISYQDIWKSFELFSITNTFAHVEQTITFFFILDLSNKTFQWKRWHIIWRVSLFQNDRGPCSLLTFFIYRDYYFFFGWADFLRIFSGIKCQTLNRKDLNSNQITFLVTIHRFCIVLTALLIWI